MLKKKENLLKKKNNLKIGFSAETRLSSLYKKDLVTAAEVDAFKKECGYLLVNLLEKILEWSPLRSVIVRNASVLDPRDILMISTDKAEKKMKSILNHLKNLKQIAPVFLDKALSQFTNFLTESEVCQDMFIESNKESDRLDDFYFKKCNINRYKEVAAVVKVLLFRGVKEMTLIL